jgi:hypothetical protein
MAIVGYIMDQTHTVDRPKKKINEDPFGMDPEKPIPQQEKHIKADCDHLYATRKKGKGIALNTQCIGDESGDRIRKQQYQKSVSEVPLMLVFDIVSR